MIALVALRVGIGLHFSVEGINKFIDKKPFVEPFLRISKGPFAPLMRSFVWDKDGLARLDLKDTENIWQTFKAQAILEYQFDDKQKAKAEEQYTFRIAQLKNHLEENGSDIDEYKKGLVRRDTYRKDRTRREVESLRVQLKTIESELNGRRSELLGPIKQIWDGYESDINAVASEAAEQRVTDSVPYPGRRFLDSKTIDVIIRYFDLIVGICLILGLFSRWIALAGAAFLFSICLSQWPWAPDAIPATYQFIEMLGMLVIAAVGAGRFAGLDYVIDKLWKSCCPSKKGTSE